MSLAKRKGKSVSLAFNAGLPANPECLADQTVRLIRLEERYVKNIASSSFRLLSEKRTRSFT